MNEPPLPFWHTIAFAFFALLCLPAAVVCLCVIWLDPVQSFSRLIAVALLSYCVGTVLYAPFVGSARAVIVALPLGAMVCACAYPIVQSQWFSALYLALLITGVLALYGCVFVAAGRWYRVPDTSHESPEGLSPVNAPFPLAPASEMESAGDPSGLRHSDSISWNSQPVTEHLYHHIDEAPLHWTHVTAWHVLGQVFCSILYESFTALARISPCDSASLIVHVLWCRWVPVTQICRVGGLWWAICYRQQHNSVLVVLCVPSGVQCESRDLRKVDALARSTSIRRHFVHSARGHLPLDLLV